MHYWKWVSFNPKIEREKKLLSYKSKTSSYSTRQKCTQVPPAAASTQASANHWNVRSPALCTRQTEAETQSHLKITLTAGSDVQEQYAECYQWGAMGHCNRGSRLPARSVPKQEPCCASIAPLVLEPGCLPTDFVSYPIFFQQLVSLAYLSFCCLQPRVLDEKPQHSAGNGNKQRLLPSPKRMPKSKR